MLKLRFPAVLAAGVAVGLLCIGCASPGNPRPPSLNLPDKATDLSALRIGDRVKISWSPPTRTTDGVDIGFPVTVEICRDPVLPPPRVKPPRPVPVPCTAVLHLPGHAGASTAEDKLPASLLAGPRLAIAYRIRLLNPSGRSAAPTAPVFAPSGPAEPVVAAFHATQTRPGVVLEWGPTPPEAAVEVTRTLVQPQAAAPKEKKQGDIPVGKKTDPAAPVLLRPATPANGMLDTAPVTGLTYTYTAQRISNVELGGRALQLRSEPTSTISVALRDTFPPAPPRGLESVPGSLNGKATLDLSWEANTESDLAGYRVYRVDLADPFSTPRLLTPEPLTEPAFRDTAVLPHHRYRYRVTALDRSGNESRTSEAIEDIP
ncbi:hypothetical protein SAMN05421771_1033 [Granulicella pectinivorans]|uniref:Fibronectin type-III domain-containing protein n=1 Tax=Granulicella pectinivorans TaxID=474950 RepID=A0A1I6LNX3_9BACT|nr:hypothetical protein SAMN05421771_1033 [Granulicella pectinivorans]